MRRSLLAAIALAVLLAFVAAVIARGPEPSTLAQNPSIVVNPSSYLVPVGGNANFTVSLNNPRVVLGSFPISVTAPPGLSFSVDPSAVVFAASGSQGSINLRVTSPGDLPPGNYSAVIHATGPGLTLERTVGFQVVPYLITIDPANKNSTTDLTIKAGSPVTWICLFNEAASGVQGSPEIAIKGGSSSPPLAEYDTWSYTFNTPGNYTYSDPVLGLVSGTISVVP